MSATVRFTTAQPQLTPPAVILNRYTGRQWWALSALLPGADRINGMPARLLTADLDTAIAIGSSGVMLGKVDDALMLMPLGLFLQLAGFDEEFHLHVEDLDLCRRTREAGYEVLIANDLTVVHVGGVSSRSRPVWVEWQKHASLWRYFRKFERRDTSWPLVPLLWVGLWGHFTIAATRAVARARGWLGSR